MRIRKRDTAKYIMIGLHYFCVHECHRVDLINCTRLRDFQYILHCYLWRCSIRSHQSYCWHSISSSCKKIKRWSDIRSYLKEWNQKERHCKVHNDRTPLLLCFWVSLGKFMICSSRFRDFQYILHCYLWLCSIRRHEYYCWLLLSTIGIKLWDDQL